MIGNQITFTARIIKVGDEFYVDENSSLHGGFTRYGPIPDEATANRLAEESVQLRTAAAQRHIDRMKERLLRG